MQSSLLSQIQKGAKLKKATTVDKSAPLIEPPKNSGGGGGGGAAPSSGGGMGMPMGGGMGGLFAGGIPQLKKKGAPGPGGASPAAPAGGRGGSDNVGSHKPSTPIAAKPAPTRPGPGPVAGSPTAKPMPKPQPSPAAHVHTPPVHQQPAAPAAAEPQGAFIGVAKALYPYNATKADELTFQPGVVINIISKDKEPWWFGELSGKRGFFPNNYVKEEPASALAAQQGPSQTYVIALYPYTGTRPDELTFTANARIVLLSKEKDPWWYGEFNGKKGMFPGNYVKPDTSAPAAAPVVASKPTCQAMYAYAATKSDELNMKPGDIITIDDESGAWWRGTCNGHTGVFPSNYVKKI